MLAVENSVSALMYFDKQQLTQTTTFFTGISICICIYFFSVSAGSVPKAGGGLADLQLGAGLRWEVHLHRGRTGPEHV